MAWQSERQSVRENAARHRSVIPQAILHLVVVLLVVVVCVPPAAAQQQPGGYPPRPQPRQPRPQTPEEAAAYEKFIAEQNPDERIRLVEDFLLQYPGSELKEAAYQVAMQAYQAKNDYDHVHTYGEMTLAENPDNLTVLLTLAAALPEMADRNSPDLEEQLTDADQFATHALELLARLRRPPGVPEEPWTRSKQESEASAHASRGLIAMLREDFGRAELELKEAVALAAKPDPVLLYRLGLSYSFRKKYNEALEVLARAASLGGVKIAAASGPSRDLVAEAIEFAARSREGSAPPVPPPPAPPSEPAAATAP